MKKKVILVALIGVMLAVGMVLVSCAETCLDSLNPGGCKVSWTNGVRDSGSGFCRASSCDVTNNYNNGTSATCNCR